jgi:ATP-binding cassette subfamily B protein
VLALGLAIAVAGVVPAAQAVAGGVLVSRVPGAVGHGFASPAGGGLASALTAVALLMVLERLVNPLVDWLRHLVSRAIDGRLRQQLLEALEAPVGISHLEDSGLQDQLGVVKGGLFGTAGSASVAALGIVGRYLQTLAAVAVVAWFSVPLAVLVLAVIVVIRRRWHEAFGALADALLSSGSELRKVTYHVDLAVTPPAAKELRIFGLLEWLVARGRRYWDEAISVPFAVRGRLRRSANVELTVLGGVYLLTFVLVARAAVRHQLGLGVVAAILQAEFSAAQLIAPTTEDFATAPGIAAWRAAQGIVAGAQDPGKPGATGSAEGLPRRQIRFEGVSFAYPGSDRPVLAGLDLALEAGRSLALVGLNGAGKTTLVKLLCRLYEPTGGRIVVDGVPLAGLDPGSWRRRLGVIFQDFVHYDLSVRDNVGFGALHLAEQTDALGKVAARAGAAEVIGALPSGWDTVLSRQYEGGADLSGGQWQRIAMARALFAVEGGARLLVLDEPTANLDVRAEAALFDEFLASTEGVTSLLISHRFSTVRRAERIAVLDEGQIVELGSHEELIARGGRYAEMFHLQAAQFAAEADEGQPVGEGRDG